MADDREGDDELTGDVPGPAPGDGRGETDESDPASGDGATAVEELPAPVIESLGGLFESRQDPLPDDVMILVCVRGMALFPGVVLPVSIGRERSVRAIQRAVQEEREIGVVLQRDAEEQDPGPDDVYDVGTVADIVRYVTAPDGSHHIIAQGRQRFRIQEVLTTEPFMTARVELIEEPPEREQDTTEIEARSFNLRNQVRQALQLLPQTPEDLDQAIQNTKSPSLLADMVATFIELPADEKQELLETVDVKERLDKVSERLAHVVEVLTLSRDIRQQTTGTLEKAQRDYYLREQLKTIQEELGEGSVELSDLREQVAKAGMPEEARAEAEKELARLERMPEASSEYGMIRGWIETMVELPWAKGTEDDIQVEKAREILDADHFGLEKIKRRILEFLAVRKLNPEGKSPILCFSGPPGVGKTSLGQSIARAMGREFVRVSLGGVHDESEIRGHRRTYVGAMPGTVITGIKRAGSNNPVFMLDEIDKLGQGGFHGDPSSALLEVLDPEQNKSFRDNYLGVPFDLSRVMFVATANVLEQIPGPLRDRCEVIELSGYTAEEKLEIAKRYLVKRQLANNGLTPGRCRLTAAALREIISHYTLEAGVRNLEREIGAVFRHAATLFAGRRRKKYVVDVDEVHEILGPPKFESELALRTSVPGVATGLSWTPYGGNILFIEATRMPGKGELILTGQLGDVMKESARTAVSLVRSRAEELDLDEDVFEKNDLHIHVPAGAIPKDGPSAGVTMVTAIVSLLTGRKAASNLAMTGEISLRGHVLPIGGVKEKVIAAHRAGCKRVLLPARNEKDLVDVPESARKKLEFVFAETIDDVLAEAFRPRGRR